MKKILLLVLALVVLSGFSVKADTVSDQNSFYYNFHLFLNSANQLVPDRNFQYSYDVIPGTFIQPTVGQFPYHGQVISLTGTVEGQFQFNVQPGKLTVEAPYAADAQKVVFYDTQNRPALTIPVSDSSYCDDNGICDSSRGENHLTCPNDCQASTLPTPAAGGSNNSTPAGGSGFITGILYAVIGLVLLGGLWWFYRRSKGGGTPSGGSSSGSSSGLPDMTKLPKFKPLVPPPPPGNPPSASPSKGNVDMPEIPRPGNPV